MLIVINRIVLKTRFEFFDFLPLLRDYQQHKRLRLGCRKTRCILRKIEL